MKVTDEEIAAVLGDARRRRLLLCLVDRERSLKEVAADTGMPLNLAHYHVRQLTAHGLVDVTREQKRAGRPIRFYRSRYSSFLVPASLFPGRPAEGLQRKLQAAVDHARDLSGGGVLFDIDENGRPRMREVQGDRPGPLEILRQLRLPAPQAKALFDEIAQVIRRYDGATGRSGAGWLIHVALGQVEL